MTTVLEEPFDTLGAWTLAGGASQPTIAAGRTGTAMQMANAVSSAAVYPVAAGSQTAVFTVGFAWRSSTVATVSGNFFQFMSDSAATIHNSITLNTNGSLAVQRGTISTLGTTAAGLIAAATWYYIELQATLGDSPAGSFTLRLNNTTVLSGTNVDTKNAGTKTVYDAIRFLGLSGSVNTFADDLYLLSGAGETFRGDIHLGGATAKTWNGSAFVDSAVKTWNGTSFVDAVAVKTWNGSAFV